MPRYRIILPALLAALMSGQLFAQPIVNVEIEGIDSELETNVRLFLSIEQQKSHPLISEGRIRRLHKKATAEIALALQPYGFYRPTVSASLTELESSEWLAKYVIEPGPGLPIAEFDLKVSGEMSDDPELLQLVEERSPKIGDTLVHPQYDAFKSKLGGLASDLGYVETKFNTARIEIDLEAYQARIHIDFDSGPRYRFGKISLKQDVLEPEFLQRYIPFKQGDPYSLFELIKLQQALNDSDYFQIADVSPGEPLADVREIPVQVTLQPRKRHRYEFGLGYGTDTGARARFGWRMPRVNKRGHRINSVVVVSEIGHEVALNYRVPVLNPRTDQLVYTISEEEEDADSNYSLLRTVGVSLNHSRGAWRETLSLNYQVEDFEVADDSGESDLLIPGISWSRTWGRDFINVIDGLRFDIGVRGASESALSDTDFAQLRGGLKFIFSIDNRNRILMRGGLGTTTTPDFEQLPSSIRFFAGGSQSVRGYAYESLGPTDEDGDVVGGRHLLTGSIEFEHYFNDRWGVAAFIDTGNAIDDFNDDLEEGVGFGMRWKSPVGPVRVDIANAVSTEEQDWRLHISIGPDL